MIELGLKGSQEVADNAKEFMDSMNMSDEQRESFKNLIVEILMHAAKTSMDVYETLSYNKTNRFYGDGD